jgi:hypothetical protein
VTSAPITINPNNAMQLLTAGNDHACGSQLGFYRSNDEAATWPALDAKCMDPYLAGGQASNPAIEIDHTPYHDGFSALATSADGTVFVTWMLCEATGVPPSAATPSPRCSSPDPPMEGPPGAPPSPSRMCNCRSGRTSGSGCSGQRAAE